MELTDARALVTGGAGFIGSHLVDALVDRGVRVRVLDDFSSGTRDNLPDGDGVDVIEGDVRDANALDAATAGVDVVFHEAAVVGVTESVENPVGTHGINATGGLNVLDAVLGNHSKRHSRYSLEIVLGTRRDAAKNNLFSHTSAQKRTDLIIKLFGSHKESIL